MAKKDSLLKNPGIVIVASYVALFLVNSLVLWLANALFPNHVVLGTFTIPVGWAILHSAGKLALVGTLLIPFINEYESRRGKPYTPRDWMVIYFGINFITLWLISRVPDQYGVGVSSWLVAALVAVVLDFAQGIAMMKLEAVRKSRA